MLELLSKCIACSYFLVTPDLASTAVTFSRLVLELLESVLLQLLSVG